MIEEIEYISNRKGVIPYTEVLPDNQVFSSAVLLCHGIFSERNEDGRFTRLASYLAENGIASWRFDYTGHGDHSLSSEEFTVSAALDDYLAVLVEFREKFAGVPVSLISSSFGGSLTLLLSQCGLLGNYQSICLLNPVVEYPNTIISPRGSELAELITQDIHDEILNKGKSIISQSGFVLTRRLFAELNLLEPIRGVDTLKEPTLVIHGTEDLAVDYEDTKTRLQGYSNIIFKTITGGTHAFPIPEHEEISFNMIIEHLRIN